LADAACFFEVFFFGDAESDFARIPSLEAFFLEIFFAEVSDEESDEEAESSAAAFPCA
jgi:hypothetical protein